ncbi:hypothetical protein [Microscilla marina]|uniref:Lipoprotein, putative n=1 Tax=Microscilla marina ATCC 23134 TaxID=313606 RepID=A1ZPZ0_MICM2|nr:hypothetical protein [Microscilla marina]EAY27645.1 lipoprotein, putative [Microscilla marina ATCC 23134]
MQKKTASFIFFLLLLVVSYACTKQASSLATAENSQAIVGKVLYTGSVAADGCGYIISAKGKRLKPVNLDQAFRQNGLDILFTYQVSNQEFSCGMQATKLTTVDILSIKKR